MFDDDFISQLFGGQAAPTAPQPGSDNLITAASELFKLHRAFLTAGFNAGESVALIIGMYAADTTTKPTPGGES